jgi:hypothetical protein
MWQQPKTRAWLVSELHIPNFFAAILTAAAIQYP